MSIQTVEFGDIYNEEYNFIKNMIQFHYTELEINHDNTLYEIKKSYNNLKSKYNLYNIKLQKIENAYECLSDKNSKDIYDKKIQIVRNLLPKYYIRV